MMIRRLFWASAAVFLLAGSAAPARGDAAAPRETEFSGSLRFFADVASLPAEDGSGETFLYVAVPLTSLDFAARSEGPPAAAVHITAIFTDRRDRRIAGDDWTFRGVTGSPDHTDDEGRSFVRRFRFRLPAGENRVRVRVEELERGRFGEMEFETEVPVFADAELSASDLVFGVCGDPAPAAPAGDFEGPVVPHPSHRYGDDAPVVCVFARIADGLDVPDTAYAVRYEVKDGSGRTRQEESLTATRNGHRGELLLRPRLAGLSLGRYRLEVRVELGDRRIDRAGWFEVDESRMSFLEDEDMIRTVLGYVATNEELIRLENEPADSLESIYRRFWARRDPTPDTRSNEALVEFMRRVDHATRNFGVLEPGWRSDMGRIYIKFGPPDQIESIADDSAGLPTQIWYYYDRNATFVFRDLDGFGRYVLSRTLRD